jgi:hypothetical protein
MCCDRFIIGAEELNWINKKTLIANKVRLMNPDVTNESLRACYRVEDEELREMLLSPRVRVKMSGDYNCCLQCYKSLKEKRIDKNPPKFAVSNHFEIGYLRDILTSSITGISGPLLSTVRPFAYVMTYNGGAYKSITGTFTFFNQDMQKNTGALNFHANLKNNMNVYFVLSGNVTPAQTENYCQQPLFG